MRRKFTWTEHQLDKLNKVNETLAELADYKPLTLRQIYYQLVGKGFIENKVSEYGMLSVLLKHARLENLIPWEDIEDRVRAFHNLSGWDDAEQFKRQELDSFLRGYRRDLMQTQETYIEIWIEKDALSSIFKKVATPFTIPVVVCKGFSSVSFLNDYRERLEEYEDKNPVLLYFGDFDPSGVEMLKAMETTLQDELNVTGIEFKRVALLKEDIQNYKLPHSPEALKKSDTRSKNYVAEFGELAVELDALRPDVLEKKIKDSIIAEIDIEAFNMELATQKKELYMLNGLKGRIELMGLT